MENSILKSIAYLIGCPDDYYIDLSVYVRAEIAKLKQLGVNPKRGFNLKDENTTWSEYLNDGSLLDLVRSYIHTVVRIKFDPPQSSAMMTALNESAKELEWRIKEEVESGGE